nr:unnamed protein product [Digitaria exilis]
MIPELRYKSSKSSWVSAAAKPTPYYHHNPGAHERGRAASPPGDPVSSPSRPNNSPVATTGPYATRQ